jgi:hypothetical protein
LPVKAANTAMLFLLSVPTCLERNVLEFPL